MKQPVCEQPNSPSGAVSGLSFHDVGPHKRGRAQTPRSARTVDSGVDLCDRDRACDHSTLTEWSYMTKNSDQDNRKHPFAAARCVLCGSVFVVKLPRGSERSWSDNGELGNPETVLAAFDFGLSAPFAAHHVAKRWDLSAVEVTAEMMQGYADRAWGPVRAARIEAVNLTKQVRELRETVRRHEAEIRALDAQIREKRASVVLAQVQGEGLDGVLAIGGAAYCWVYALVDAAHPKSHRYIGSTDSPFSRLKQHLSSRGSPEVGDWATDVEASGSSVLMVSLWQGTCRQAAFDVEKRMITEARALGMADLNSKVPGQPARPLDAFALRSAGGL